MIKEMIYKDVTHSGDILYKGKYKGITFLVVSYGTHPCAYLVFDKNHYMFGKQEEQADDIVCVHGGFTYSEYGHHLLKDSKSFWVLGWDYCHCDDKFGSSVMPPGFGSKVWTTIEIIDECRQYIDTIVLKTPSLNLERNPLLDVISTEMRSSGRELFKVRSQEPTRDYVCKLRFFGALKDVTHKTIEKLKGVAVYLTKCKYCGERFLTNSRLCSLCSDDCFKKNSSEVTKKYMQKYMARNRKEIGYSFGWYAKNRKDVLRKIKEKNMKILGKRDFFICKVCGKVCRYLEGYSLRSVVCKNPVCRKKYYSRKK